MNEAVDVIEALIASPGWAYIRDTARREWMERERMGRRKALEDTEDKRALDKLRQITAAQEAVEWVLALPTEEIARLKRAEQQQEQHAPLNGRQSSSPVVSMMNRRGSL